MDVHLNTPLALAVDAYIVSRATRKDSPATTSAIRNDVQMLSRHLADVVGCQVEELTVAHLSLGLLRQAFADYSASHAKASISRAWSMWNGFCTFLVMEGGLEGNPISGIARPRPERTSPKALRGEDTARQLLLAIASGTTGGRHPWPERDLALFTTLLSTGLRSAELLALTLRDVVGEPGEQRLHVKGKGNHERSVPLDDDVAALITAYLATRRTRFPGRLAADAPLFVNWQGQVLGKGALSHLVRDTYRRAGIYDRVPSGALVHAMRHTFATAVVGNGASAVEAMKLLGHQSLVTTQRYIDASATELRSAAAGNPLRGIALADLSHSPAASDARSD